MASRKRKEKKKRGTMDTVLVIIAIVLVLFIIALLWIYVETGGIPDTLCTCVFAICGGEFGVLGWIKNNNERNKTRQYELEDRIYRRLYNERKEEETV